MKKRLFTFVYSSDTFSMYQFFRYKAWFSLNDSVIETNCSCLLAQTLLRFAGFHRQLWFRLLRGLLYLEACKSCIQLEITTFLASSLYFLFLSLSFFLKTEKKFFVVGVYRSQSQCIAAHACQAFRKIQHVRLRCQLAGFNCEGWDCASC